MKKRKGQIGAPFDDYLKEGHLRGVTARAIKRVIARQLDALMEDQGLTKSALAKRMKTSRAQLDRLLDPGNRSVTLGTLTPRKLSGGSSGWGSRRVVPAKARDLLMPSYREDTAYGSQLFGRDDPRVGIGSLLAITLSRRASALRRCAHKSP